MGDRTMTAEQARAKLAATVEKEGNVAVAYHLKCSVTQVMAIARGTRRPGLKIACAIEGAYAIPAQVWIK